MSTIFSESEQLALLGALNQLPAGLQDSPGVKLFGEHITFLMLHGLRREEGSPLPPEVSVQRPWVGLPAAAGTDAARPRRGGPRR